MSETTNTYPPHIENTAANRPAATNVPAGTIFKATDGGLSICVIGGSTRVWMEIYAPVEGQSEEDTSFTPSPSVGVYLLIADGLTITLSDTDPIGTTYLFWSTTGTAAPLHTIQPSSGTINGGPSVTFSVQWGVRAVKRTGASTWQMGQ